MRTFYPNFDDEYGLETVFEVPIPEEMFPATKNKWPNNIKSYMKFNPGCYSTNLSFIDRNSQVQLLLGVIGAPLFPLPVNYDRKFCNSIKDDIIESSMANYIIAQYVAAVGGECALNSVDSMYAVGKVKMVASEFSENGLSVNKQRVDNSKIKKVKGMKHGCEVGGFVFWSKIPDLWCLELVVSGVKVCAGCDGKVAWRQTPWNNFHASKGTPRPLRRALQGLDPRLTADLFANSICVGERTVNGEDCFALKMEADPTTFEAKSGNNIDIIRHTVLGYFSQKSGLLVQLQDSHLLRINASKNNTSTIFQETTMESSIKDYRTIDGINIAHSGRTSVSMFKYDENNETHSSSCLDEVWSIEDVGFNIKGLTMDCFLPPADLKKEDEEEFPVIIPYNTKSTTKARNTVKLATSKVVAIDYDYWKNLDGS